MNHNDNPTKGKNSKKGNPFPLHIACQEGFTDEALMLIEQGASVNEKGTKGSYTPLHSACVMGHIATAL